MRRWLHSGPGVAGADGAWRPAKPNCGGRLFRSGFESRCAGDGRRAWRSDPVGRLDGGLLSGVDLSIWAAAVAGSCDTGRGVSGPSARICGTDSRPCGRWMRVRVTCGRDHELHWARTEVAELQAAVKAHRLVTLTGVGGVGKTRLALEVAARLADEFPDGVWFFELAAVTDPAAIPDAVAAVLGITQQPGKTVTESVAAALEGRVAAAGVRQLRARSRRCRRSDPSHPRALGDCHESSPPAAKDSESPTSNCGRCPRWTWARAPIPPR